MKKILLLAFFSIFGVILSSCSSSTGSSKPEDVAVKFVEAMYEGDAEQAYGLLYIPEEELKKPGLEEIVKGKIKQGIAKAEKKSDENGGVKSVRADRTELEENGERGKVWVITEFNNANSKSETDRIKVINNDGTWKISI